jgi:hypothetical protein
VQVARADTLHLYSAMTHHAPSRTCTVNTSSSASRLCHYRLELPSHAARGHIEKLVRISDFVHQSASMMGRAHGTTATVRGDCGVLLAMMSAVVVGVGAQSTPAPTATATAAPSASVGGSSGQSDSSSISALWIIAIVRSSTSICDQRRANIASSCFLGLCENM